LKLSGNETVLHSFPSDSEDGEYPLTAGLVNVDGTLYGTTYEGGAYGFGTVFAITPSGEETVLHSFGPYNGDGRYPTAALIDMKGKLYGTTTEGGAGGEGSVFAISTAGTETVVYGFKGPPDGTNPDAPLTAVTGTLLYGTTSSGGVTGRGTVFAITTSGKETVLHSFGGYGDGDYPGPAGLLNAKGTLYGTTESGGVKGEGTVFLITASGKETVLHSFGYPDGYYPHAGLINVKGTFYGTTESGGGKDDGTVFSITTSGKENVVHSFKLGHNSDGPGSFPLAGLLNIKGTLYGTTTGGGAFGEGTVFWLLP
jgi:uncharacterized repeat protein (TIGR03803 family)